MGQLFECKWIAQQIKDSIRKGLENYKGKRKPKLAIVMAGNDPASEVYVKNKIKACAEVGIETEIVKAPENISEGNLISAIESLNKDGSVDGIIVQLPLPENVRKRKVLDSVIPKKDVDGLASQSIANLYTYEPGFKPCTAKGICKVILEIFKDSANLEEATLEQAVSGKRVTVVGRSELVGSPVARMLQNAGATVTIAHSKTEDLQAECSRADILIVAIGKPEMIKVGYIKPHAWVIDVGINRNEEGKIVGDVTTGGALIQADYVTPVPGGIGPMTVAELLENTFEAYKKNMEN